MEQSITSNHTAGFGKAICEALGEAGCPAAPQITSLTLPDTKKGLNINFNHKFN
jgi:hypothetical protein